jgi:hypothetical protein
MALCCRTRARPIRLCPLQTRLERELHAQITIFDYAVQRRHAETVADGDEGEYARSSRESRVLQVGPMINLTPRVTNTVEAREIARMSAQAKPSA